MSRYLSRLDLDMIADRYTGRYFKLLQSKPGELPPIDPILLAEEIVKLNVSFTPLCDDGSVLGLAVFEDVLLTVCLPNGKIVSYQLSDGDVLIDTGLQQDGLLGRCNFTIAHEAGHHILNRLFPEEHRQMRNRRTHIMYRRRTESVNWVEWQADTIASSLLMPRQLIYECMPRFGLGKRIDILNKLYRPKEYQQFCEMADYLGVSKQALSIRRKQLHLLGKDYLANPNELPRVYCDESDLQFI